MAVNFAQATAIHNPSSHYNMFNSSQRQPSPLSSAPTTPANLSPTSPRTSSSPRQTTLPPFQSRQLRPPKAPLYVPAVLRPTECPASFAKHSAKSSVAKVSASTKPTVSVSAPITPPSSTGSSFDSKHSLDEALLHRRLLGEEISGVAVTRVVTDEWHVDALEAVTGAPTRDHWKPDSSSPTCEYQPCAIPFTFLNRRHHCRRCGLIFCAPHSQYKVPLDQFARFHPEGTLERACQTCFADYGAWQRVRKARVEGNQGSGTTTPVPIKTAKAGTDSSSQSPPDSASDSAGKRIDSMAESFGKDWTWSTF